MTPAARALLWLGAMLLLVALPRPAAAQTCSATATDMNFGTISTSGNAAYQSTATITVTCDGDGGNRYNNDNDTVQICPYIGAGSGAGASGPRYMAAGSATLAFDLYQDSAMTRRFANGVVTGANDGYTITLNRYGNGSRTITVYGKIPAGQQGVPPGSYTVDLAAGTQVAYAQNRYSYSSDCSDVGTRNMTSSISFDASANNPASCTLATSPVQFGAVSSLDAAHDANGAVSVTCTSGASFTVAINGGANGGTSGTTRKMANGGARITYGLYQNYRRTTPWYSDAAGVMSGTGTGSAQSFTVYGRVPAQASPAPGTYTDTVVVTLSY